MATLTKKKQKEVTFIARATDLRLVIEPGDVVRNDRGQIIRTYPGKAIEFQQGRFTAPADSEDLEVLRNHPGFNVDFWEIGNAPGEPRPTFAEQNARIIRALAEGDTEAIQAVVNEERDTHKRDSVFEAAEAALNALAGDSDEAPDERTS